MGEKKYYIILGIIGFFIVGILAFDLYVLKFGKFWEKKITTQQSPAHIPLAEFIYDFNKAEAYLSEYLKGSLKEEYLPPKINVEQGLSISGKKSGLDFEFGSNWVKDNNSIYSNLHYQKSTNTIQDVEIFVKLSNVPQSTASTSLANSLVATLFKNISPTIKKCGAKRTTSYCEEFSSEDSGKKGFGIVLAFENSKLAPIVFTCFIPKGSVYYNQQNSCISIP